MGLRVAVLAAVAVVAVGLAVGLVGCGDPARPELGRRVTTTTATPETPSSSTTASTATTSTRPATGPTTTTTPASDPTTTTTPATTGPTGRGTGPGPGPTVVATAREGISEIAVYDAPTGTRTATVANPAEYGQAQVFRVQDRVRGFVQVNLPIRPNGSTGWIRADDVTLAQHDWRIEVSLSDFELRLFQGGEAVLTSPVGVGRTDRPTPGGEYYTWVLLDPTNNGYGDYAYGLSGFSEALANFAGGDARLGLHGTADESTIGTEVSSGCIRVPNDTVTRMVEDIGLPLGVPVEVTA